MCRGAPGCCAGPRASSVLHHAPEVLPTAGSEASPRGPDYRGTHTSSGNGSSKRGATTTAAAFLRCFAVTFVHEHFLLNIRKRFFDASKRCRDAGLLAAELQRQRLAQPELAELAIGAAVCVAEARARTDGELAFADLVRRVNGARSGRPQAASVSRHAFCARDRGRWRRLSRGRSRVRSSTGTSDDARPGGHDEQDAAGSHVARSSRVCLRALQ